MAILYHFGGVVRKFILCFILLGTAINAKEKPYSLALVHIGNDLPPFIETCVYQIRLFNPTVPIHLIVSRNMCREHQDLTEKYDVTLVDYSTLTTSDLHRTFLRYRRPLNRKLRKHWTVRTQMGSVERFFILDEFMEQYGLTNVFQIETDNMIYFDFDELFPIFDQCYPGIAATFDNERRAIAGVMFIRNRENLEYMLDFIGNHWKRGIEDFTITADARTYYQDQGQSTVCEMPVVCQSYVENEELRRVYPNHPAPDPMVYCRNIDKFHSIFDAAAWGQYLGGTPHGELPGFINTDAIVDPSKQTLEWRVDDEGRRIPYVTYGNETYRMNNLHIHKKSLELFVSK